MRQRYRRGLGLLEVVIALGLLMMSILASLYIFPFCAQSQQQSRQYLIANHLCRQQIEQVIGQPIASVTPQTITATSSPTEILGGSPGTEIYVSTTQIQPNASNPQLMDVQCQVQWTSGSAGSQDARLHSTTLKTTVGP